MANNRAIRWELACLLLPGALNGGRVSESVGIKRAAFLLASVSDRKRPDIPGQPALRLIADIEAQLLDYARENN